MMIGVAVVGLGWWGKVVVKRISSSERLRVLRAVDTDVDSVRPFAEENGLALSQDLNDALSDSAVGAVVLTTPHSTHVDLSLRCAAAGKNVFCEKPLALTTNGAEKIVRACQEAGVVLGVGHERRFEPALTAIKSLIEDGALGAVQHVEANSSHDLLLNLKKGDWRTSAAEAPAAGMTGLGVHLTDAFIDMFGPVAEVFARTAGSFGPFEAGDTVLVTMRFVNGMTGYLNSILTTPQFNRYHVFGPLGWAQMLGTAKPGVPGPSELSVCRQGADVVVEEFAWMDTVSHNFERFADAIEGAAAYPFTDEQLIHNVSVLEAIARSVETGAPTTVG